jgi:hypothetical protein
MQNREAPAYQEYAASMLAKLDYRTLSLTERGLLYSLRLELWVNDRLPSNPAKLARVLGYAGLESEVEKALAAIMPFFAKVDDFLISPELDNYKIHLADAKKRMSEGGQKGMKKRYGKNP